MEIRSMFGSPCSTPCVETQNTSNLASTLIIAKFRKLAACFGAVLQIYRIKFWVEKRKFGFSKNVKHFYFMTDAEHEIFISFSVFFFFHFSSVQNIFRAHN